MNKDFYQRVAEGEVSGYSFIEKFGYNPDITTATDPEDVWTYGGIYTFSTAADITQIASSNAGDTQDIMIEGLDANWEIMTKTVTLNGQTPVTLSGDPFLRVYRMMNVGSTDLSGDVNLITSGGTFTAGVPDTANTVRANITNGDNQTEMCIYSVPAGKTAYFLGGYVSQLIETRSASEVCTFTWRVREFGGVFRVQSRIPTLSDGNSYFAYKYPVPVGGIPEKSDIVIRAETVSATMGAAGGFTVLLKDNPS